MPQYCQASVVADGISKPIKIVFASGAQISNIGETLATGLALPMFNETVAKTASLINGDEVSCLRFTSSKVVMGGFEDQIRAIVLPGDSPYLVLGMDWFRRHNPVWDFAEGTITIHKTHAIQLVKEQDDKVVIFGLQLRDSNPSQVWKNNIQCEDC